MKHKDDLIAQAALAQFAKFGLRKTTMQDVADAAGVSRQTLYNRVPNKDALLRLVARYYFTNNINRCREALKACPDLPSSWDVLISHFVVEVWHTVNAMPEADAFEASANDVIAVEVADAITVKTALIGQMLTTHNAVSQNPGQTPQDIGQFFCATAVGIKTSAKDEASLNALASTLKQTMLSLTALDDYRHAS